MLLYQNFALFYIWKLCFEFRANEVIDSYEHHFSANMFTDRVLDTVMQKQQLQVQPPERQWLDKSCDK